MKKILLILVILFSVTESSLGQTIHEVFKLLPNEYTPELTMRAKVSLMESGIYTIPGGDSLETMEYSYSSDREDYLRLDFYFTTGQRGFSVVELRKFKKSNGEALIVYSKFGGAQHAFDQHILVAFDYNMGKLKINEWVGLPKTIGAKEFLKQNVPENLKEDLPISTSYNLLSEEPNSVEYLIDSQTDSLNDWISENRILFTWDGNKFQKRKE